VNRLVIGVPARNEAATVGELAGRLEEGAAALGEEVAVELVLAYQASEDDTLDRWRSRRFRLPNRVLDCPGVAAGKGRNVKLLVRHAQEHGAHLLLVDADLAAFPPANVGNLVHANPLEQVGLVLPLWCRPAGQGNSTNFLACPLLLATFGARVRQPLAGQMLLGRRLLATVDADSLPDDYGVDVTLTMLALDAGLPVRQVGVPFPVHHDGGNSHQIMADVAGAILRRLARRPGAWRPDVRWPARYWEQLAPPLPSTRSLEPLVAELAPPDDPEDWRRLLAAPPEVVRDLWCAHLTAAVQGARRGEPVPSLVASLAFPFALHAEYRRRVVTDIGGAEAYVERLGEQLAGSLS